MELDKNWNPITPSENTPDDIQPSANDAPENSEEKKEDWEKRFKDTQASFTKDQLTKLAMAKMLVDTDPSKVESIPDDKIKAKVLQEKWWVDSVEELKTLYPKALTKPDGAEEEQLDEMEQLKQTVKLMQYRDTKTKTNDAISDVIKENEDLSKQVPEIETKVREQLKYISEDLSPKERADMALKIVLSTSVSKADVYSMIQWTSTIKAPRNEEEEIDIEDSPLWKAFANAGLRKAK